MLVTAMIMEQVGIVGWLSPTNLSLDKTMNFFGDQSQVTQILIACLFYKFNEL